VSGSGAGGLTRVSAVRPDPELAALLPGAQFVDAYAASLAGACPSAIAAAHRMLDHPPAWFRGLIRLRDVAVAPFGVTTTRAAAGLPGPRIGFFPLLRSTPDEVVLGLEDSHLDFRLVVRSTPQAGGGQVTVTTVVRLNNLFGRLYLATITPAHRLIMRAFLRRLSLRSH
jgi:hypothetical protein